MEIVVEMEMLALRNAVKERKQLEINREGEGISCNENLSALPNGLRKNGETAIKCRGHGCTKEKNYKYQ